MSTTAAPELVREDVDSRGISLRVDRDKSVIHGVKVLGYQSKNNREYKRSALQNAVRLYEGARVNVNHKKDLRAPRDYQERMGVIRNAVIGEQGIFGDLHFNPKHAVAEQLVWDAEHAPENVGLSPVHTVITSKQNGKTIVESIESVTSVDLVADPATTRTLFEHVEEDTGVSLKELTVEQLREERADLVEAILADKSNDDELVRLRAKVEALSEEVKTYKAAEQKAALEKEVDALLAEHKVPEIARTDTFRRSLLVAESKDARVELIKDRIEFVAAAKKSGPTSRERITEHASSKEAPKSSKDFAALIAG